MIDEKGNEIKYEYWKCWGVTWKENNNNSYKECHCNDCINRIVQMEEFKKWDKFLYKDFTIKITSFCPLKHCSDIFLSWIERPAFWEWFNLEDVRNLREYL